MLRKKHYYNSDHPERRMIHVYLAILGILSSYSLFWLTNKYAIQIAWWVDAPAVFGFYGIFYWMFSNYLWKNPILRGLGVVKTPNWNGEYTGKLHTSFDDFEKDINFKIIICQEWDKIQLTASTETSTSYSVIASFLIQDCIEPILSYTYQSEPQSDADQTMNMHFGMGKMKKEGTNLKGEYFNGRGRNTWGSFVLVRI